MRIHFLHVRGHGPAPLPIILTHGWPGSFLEMLKLIPLLSNPEEFGGDPQDAFDVVVPVCRASAFPTSPRRPG